ncbi:MAG: O-antigen ligase family protein [Planctomycetota bacterium]
MLRVLAVLATYAFGTAFGVRNAVIASCLFIWNDIFRPVSWARRGSILSAPWFKPVHLCTAVLLCAVIFGPWKRRWNTTATQIVIFVVWIWCLVITAIDRELAVETVIMSTKYFLPLAFISASLVDRRAQYLFTYALALSVGVWLIHYGVMTFFRQAQETAMAIPHGQMTERNDFLVAGTACLPMLCFMGWHYHGRHFRKPIRLLFKAGSVISISAFFFSLSRGAIVGLAALSVWYAIATGGILKRLPIAAVFVVIAFFALPQQTIDRMMTIEVEGEQSEGSAANRIEHMKNAIDVTLKYPLTGVGPNNFWKHVSKYGGTAEPHSIWLKCSAEYGLPMLFFFLWIIGSLLLRLRNKARVARARGDKETESFCTMLSCAIVGFLATGTFTSQFLSQYLWSIFALAGAFLATPDDNPLQTVLPWEKEAPVMDYRAAHEGPDPEAAVPGGSVEQRTPAV